MNFTKIWQNFGELKKQIGKCFVLIEIYFY